MMCHGFASFSEASYAGWEISRAFSEALNRKYNLGRFARSYVPRDYVNHDRELWDLMVETIAAAGYEGKIGLQIDVAAGTYYDKGNNTFVGLFSEEDKTRDDLIELYKDTATKYPFIILEDPLDEDDYEGHAILTR